MGSPESSGEHCMNIGWRASRAVILCLVCTLLTAPYPLLAQPAFFEPKEHYYKAKGIGLQVKWEVPRTTVEDGREFRATLVVSRASNPTEIVKPDLSNLPEFAKRFKATDVPDRPRMATDKDVRFEYKLQPRNRSVDQLPALDFYYHNTAAAPGTNPFRLTRADSVTIAVTAPPEPVKVPMVEADHLFRITGGPEVLGTPFVPCRWAWTAAGLFGPLAAFGWFLVWRRIYPDGARLANLRRSRAARRATDTIRKSGRMPDPAPAIAAAVLGYLRIRFPLSEAAVTPSEIEAALTETQVPADVVEQVVEVFRACDRARFAPPGDRGESLAAEAETAIARLEALA